MPRVLIVDDDEPIRRMVALAFELEGFEVEMAADGMDGIVKAELFAPDVMILDIMMPRMDGLTTLAHLRQQPATARLPVLLLSAKADSTDIAIGLRAGASDYVTKPFETDDLITRAGEAINRPASARTTPARPPPPHQPVIPREPRPARTPGPADGLAEQLRRPQARPSRGDEWRGAVGALVAFVVLALGVAGIVAFHGRVRTLLELVTGVLGVVIVVGGALAVTRDRAHRDL